MRIAVTGASGFIGRVLCRTLLKNGHIVHGVYRDKPNEILVYGSVCYADMTDPHKAKWALQGCDAVISLAADVGGIGYLHSSPGQIMKNNLLIDINTLNAALHNNLKKIVYASSACVYPTDSMKESLSEADIFPLNPNEGYGWAKLTTEKLLELHRDKIGVRIARLHTVYGPGTTVGGNREKVVTALCRKVAQAMDGDEITIWGNGKQERTFCYIDDVVDALVRLLYSSYDEPMNIGSSELLSVDTLADKIIKISGKRLYKRYDLAGPMGASRRGTDITLARSVLGWQPETPLDSGLTATYDYVRATLSSKTEKSEAT